MEGTSSLQKEIEELINKTIEANRVFMNEGTQLMKQMGQSPGKPINFNIFQNEFITNSLKSYASLNISYLKNMVDLGISLTRQMGNRSGQTNDEPITDPIQPSFELKTNARPGETVTLHFLLDNIKDADVTCELVNTRYQHQSEFSLQPNFPTTFIPQSFLLNKGSSRDVLITIEIPKNTKPGVYISQVQVKGFEPAFFSINLTINQQ